jgi:dimeric dUTPase (all-alpha-NTP-PPase superfamily)
MNERNTKQVEAMLKLQVGFNDKLKPDWMTNPPNYCDAIWTEAAEAFDYTNWPWWKKQGQQINYDQIKMEVVDIWHFLMSDLMCHEANEELDHLKFIQVVYDDKLEQREEGYSLEIVKVQNSIRDMVRSAVYPRSEERIILMLSAFTALMMSLEMDWDELYKLYVGKNTLNKFRQANGYKDDTTKYINTWARIDGLQDNDHLTELLITVDASKPVDEFQEEVLEKLQHLFNSITPVKN